MILLSYHERPAKPRQRHLLQPVRWLEELCPLHHLEEAGMALRQPVADRWPEDTVPRRRRHDALAVARLHVHPAGLHVVIHHGPATPRHRASPLGSTLTRTRGPYRTRLRRADVLVDDFVHVDDILLLTGIQVKSRTPSRLHTRLHMGHVGVILVGHKAPVLRGPIRI